ncbi:FAD-dependent monooxygenase [Streptomyces sp. PTM05]|uniref:FAD-dependent monooxygenase n=1 Tax=Streptantibioticus parmotrematis TaxID=2873249 RepID=A0ABS7QUR2_9ACTN|nr:FAD-dependent monooxygenase [Streptantibioticus parmotrematis]MBY8885524.1 FAD-dependent monooxygenase [Streptantibioticus parmotrematis]
MTSLGEQHGNTGELAVAIAGGGPVGLAVAAFLDAAGVPVEVFERATVPSEHSKATVMHPRTLETLEVLTTPSGGRFSEELLARGRTASRTHFALLPSLLDYAGLDTPYPFVLLIPQARTERLLEAHLRERGVPVRRGCEVTGFEQHEDGVRVRLGDGTVREVAHLVGADGAHSVVRRLAEVDFPGSPPSALGFGADVELDRPPEGISHQWFAATGSVSVIPLPDGGYRVFGTEAADTRLDPETIRERRAQPLTPEGLRAAMRRVVGHDFGLRSVSWLTRSTDVTRHASRYRVGRVHLAGDAAHVHLPAGGQGLNVGLQDAANLAWKLAAEIRGWATPALTHGELGYEHERRRVAERLAANTLAQGALMHDFSPSGAALRELFADLIARGGDTARELTGWLSGLGLDYPQPDGAHPLAGTRAPDLALRPVPGGGPGGSGDDRLLRALRVDRFLLADFTPDGAFADLACERVAVRRALPREGAWASAGAALVRPDGYVAHATAAADPGAMAEALGKWVATAESVSRPTAV